MKKPLETDILILLLIFVNVLLSMYPMSCLDCTTLALSFAGYSEKLLSCVYFVFVYSCSFKQPNILSIVHVLNPLSEYEKIV